MKLITLLGTGKYEETVYRWAEREKSTRFIQEALVEWLQPKTTCVLLTQGARNKNWGACRPLLEGKTNIQEVDIPDGKSEQELRQIFSAIDRVVEEGDTLAFDITHSFRSLPMITLLVIAYLKQVKSVQIAHLLYGAFEAKNEKGQTPVFELTPFVELLDWLTAAKMFIATGDSRELAGLLEKEQNTAWRLQQPNAPRRLKSLANALKKVSSNLLLSRVPLLAESVKSLRPAIEDAQAEIGEHATPLIPLLKQIEQAYRPFEHDDLQTQLELIGWYLERGHVVQAMTLAREWLISYQVQLDGQDANNLDRREDAARTLNEAHHNRADDLLTKVWGRVIELRNDIAHCGFGRAEGQVLKAEDIIEQAREVYGQLRDIWEKRALNVGARRRHAPTETGTGDRR
ncbi:hypothetical protein HRbin15_01373 [bacterium HR15]|nr:hypothetical protein HRbin15_01373 [bacterium HR15]